MTENSCLKWSPDTGIWEKLLTLDVDRTSHVTWTPDAGMGTYLIGGSSYGNAKTTTLITPDGGQEPGFSLEYQTRYLSVNCYYIQSSVPDIHM